MKQLLNNEEIYLEAITSDSVSKPSRDLKQILKQSCQIILWGTLNAKTFLNLEMNYLRAKIIRPRI